MPPAVTQAESHLTRHLLASVSRSFYLSLRILPRAMRDPVSLAYLLARLTDTIADSSGIDPGRRLDWLGNLRQAITDEAIADKPAIGDWQTLATDIGPGVQHPSERELLRRTGECLARLRSLPQRDRNEIATVLNEIVSGQIWDVEWFELAPQQVEDAGAQETLGTMRVRCSPDAKALHDYTYAVAGSVGRFWTRMCEQHAPGWRREETDAARIERDGEQLGRGLQFINILRDAPKDLRIGRCYLPLTTGASGAPELRGDAADLAQRVREAAQPWMDVCQERLDAGARYAAGVRHRRLRLAAALPWLLAEHTLDRLRKADATSWRAGVKLSRPEVKSLLRRTAWRVLCGRSLEPLRPVREDPEG